MELDHILPKAEGGSDVIENAIPVCFECHAEIHLYNDKHPRGKKYSPEELRAHKDQWLQICQKHPESLLGTQRAADVGPLQALIDELEFNQAVIKRINDDQQPTVCPFETTQFTRTIAEGILSLLDDELRTAIADAYAWAKSANGAVASLQYVQTSGELSTASFQYAKRNIIAAQPALKKALSLLQRFLATERDT
jgi:hypothetical protein